MLQIELLRCSVLLEILESLSMLVCDPGNLEKQVAMMSCHFLFLENVTTLENTSKFGSLKI